MIRRAVRYLDQRAGAAGFVRKALRYVFPDHWSFMFGEIALYAFLVLVATGVYLALFFRASLVDTTYHGSYAPLAGHRMSDAYRSVLELSLHTRAGLLIRQVHHWAADVFVAAIVIHMMRVFFTGAFRRPRDLNWMVGLTMLGAALLEGFMGYSLVDDLLSGMGVAIAYGVVLAIPLIGAPIAFWVWGGEYADDWISRFYVGHVFLLPVLIGTLIAVHLLLIARPHHTQFPGPGRRERNTVGSPMWPGYALRSIGLMLGVAAVLFLLGGLVQINPIWEWGPFEPYLSTNGAQPDWYLGWLIGALRLMPAFDVTIGGYTIIPNPFWGGILFPTVVLGTLYLWPWIERVLSGDLGEHHLLDRPRDAPRRTAFGCAFTAWVATTFLAGSSDQLFVHAGLSYDAQVWFWRVMFFVAPPVTYVIVRRACEGLRGIEAHPLRGWSGRRVRRNAAGGFEAIPSPGEVDAGER